MDAQVIPINCLARLRHAEGLTRWVCDLFDVQLDQDGYVTSPYLDGSTLIVDPLEADALRRVLHPDPEGVA